MADFTFTLDGNPLPMPRADNPFDMEYMPLGSQRRAASGKLRVDHVASRWRVQVFWEGLTQAERDQLWNYFGTYIATVGTLVLPTGLSIEVMVGLNSWSENQLYDPWTGEVLYDVSFEFQQV